MNSDSPPRSNSSHQLGVLAMRFRRTRDEAARRAIAAEYAHEVERLIKSGNWAEAPAFEDQLPDEWMPEAFFAYWCPEPRPCGAAHVPDRSLPRIEHRLGIRSRYNEGGRVYRRFAMVAKGRVQNGVIVLAEGVCLPEGQEVAVLAPLPASAPASGTPEDRGWPPGYFESTFGSITDETFVRPPQGELPKPVELE